MTVQDLRGEPRIRQSRNEVKLSMRLPLCSTGLPTKVDQRFSSISAPFHSPLPPFFPKDNPRQPPFCLLSEIACSEIDRRLRPTDVCSAATALTLRHRKNIIGFSFLIFFLTHRLLLFGFFSAWERARAKRGPAPYSSFVRARQNIFLFHHACAL